MKSETISPSGLTDFYFLWPLILHASCSNIGNGKLRGRFSYFPLKYAMIFVIMSYSVLIIHRYKLKHLEGSIM